LGNYVWPQTAEDAKLRINNVKVVGD